MATTSYFDEVITDQDGKTSLQVEVARCSFYAGCPVPGGIGEDSILLTVEGKSVIMDRATAKRFVKAVVSVGYYHGMID